MAAKAGKRQTGAERLPTEDNMPVITGSIPALVTPFRDGRVDEKALTAFVEWQIA